MFAKSVLDNRIRVVSQEMTDHRSVSLGIWVENGSRHELQHQNGISHFIEHLLFKGTTTRTAAQIAEEMDAVGGLLNAFTSKEHTCYYAKVLDENLPLAIDLEGRPHFLAFGSAWNVLLTIFHSPSILRSDM